MNIGYIQGGTNAGWRKVAQQVKENWICSCGARCRYFWANCPSCGNPRD